MSLAEVSRQKFSSRIFNQADPAKAPDPSYLNRKRSSVFHKAFESREQVMKDFVPPVHAKPDDAK